MKYFSLFSGIGGFELGIQLAYEIFNMGRSTGSSDTENGRHLSVSDNSDGHGRRSDTSILECVGFSEIDKYAVQVYEKHFNHKNYGDITKINEAELPEFDLLVGGFPCQSFSIAGKRGGFNDTRGTLFFDIARILKAKQPRLLLLENVKGLLSHDEGRTFATIISTLDELGYDLQWQVLNSKNFGVPQNRERVFIIGHIRGTPRPKVFPLGSNDGTATDIQGHVANTLTARYEGAQATGTYIEEGKFDAQIQQINLPTHSNDRVYGAEGIAPTLNTMQGGRRQPKVATYRHSMEGFKGYEEMSPSIKSSEGSGNQILIDGIRRLTPTECERLQGFPDGWTDSVSNTQRYKCLGNAVTVNVIKEIVKSLIT